MEINDQNIELLRGLPYSATEILLEELRLKRELHERLSLKRKSNVINNEFRLGLFELRGGKCEYCSKNLDKNKFHVHHTDYDYGQNPRYLKIVDSRCHGIITFYGEREGKQIIRDRIIDNKSPTDNLTNGEDEKDLSWEEYLEISHDGARLRRASTPVTLTTDDVGPVALADDQGVARDQDTATDWLEEFAG